MVRPSGVVVIERIEGIASHTLTDRPKHSRAWQGNLIRFLFCWASRAWLKTLGLAAHEPLARTFWLFIICDPLDTDHSPGWTLSDVRTTNSEMVTIERGLIVATLEACKYFGKQRQAPVRSQWDAHLRNVRLCFNGSRHFLCLHRTWVSCCFCTYVSENCFQVENVSTVIWLISLWLQGYVARV